MFCIAKMKCHVSYQTYQSDSVLSRLAHFHNMMMCAALLRRRPGISGMLINDHEQPPNSQALIIHGVDNDTT